MFELRSFDYIVDAMDVSASKVLLIERAGNCRVPVISCLATDNKINPARLEIADISRVSNDPLAKAIRAELRKKNIRKVKVLCSREKAYRERRIGRQKENHEHIQPGSISFIPGVAGMLIAGEVVKDLLTEKIKKKDRGHNL